MLLHPGSAGINWATYGPYDFFHHFFETSCSFARLLDVASLGR
jgi:hypothetical protein